MIKISCFAEKEKIKFLPKEIQEIKDKSYIDCDDVIYNYKRSKS